mgnify:CR=1 FL=1
MNKNTKNKSFERNIEMYKAILTLETVDECMRFFDDLCSALRTGDFYFAPAFWHSQNCFTFFKISSLLQDWPLI